MHLSDDYVSHAVDSFNLIKKCIETSDKATAAVVQMSKKMSIFSKDDRALIQQSSDETKKLVELISDHAVKFGKLVNCDSDESRLEAWKEAKIASDDIWSATKKASELSNQVCRRVDSTDYDERVVDETNILNVADAASDVLNCALWATGDFSRVFSMIYNLVLTNNPDSVNPESKTARVIKFEIERMERESSWANSDYDRIVKFMDNKVVV